LTSLSVAATAGASMSANRHLRSLPREGDRDGSAQAAAAKNQGGLVRQSEIHEDPGVPKYDPHVSAIGLANLR
jgi:hypothetical protein